MLPHLGLNRLGRLSLPIGEPNEGSAHRGCREDNASDSDTRRASEISEKALPIAVGLSFLVLAPRRALSGHHP